jgi:hypothetical protein
MAIGFQVTFDAHDPAALARFWSVALDYERQPPPPGFDSWEAFAENAGIPQERWGDMDAVVDPGGSGPRLLFQRVPEGKTAKNRVHLDVNVSGPDHDWAKVEAHAERLVSAGARLVEKRQDGMSHWIVMQDAEGNEFCLQ